MASATRLLRCAALLSALLAVVYAQKELKFNAGGLKVGEYETDPVSFVKGKSAFHRGDSSDSSVGASHRWSGDNGFAYEFPLGNGLYDVELQFAEVFPSTQFVGARVFSVAIEDDMVMKDFDAYKEKGADLVTKSFKAQKVEDGALTIALIKGLNNNPMISSIKIVSADGKDLKLDGEVVTGEGVSTTEPAVDKEFDHQAHAVAGGPYVGRDFNGDDVVQFEIDGTLSHSHYNNPDTGDTGRIVSYKWTSKDKVVSTLPKFVAAFNVGVTELVLTVEDQTGDVATAKTTVTALPSIAGGAYCYYYPGAKDLPPGLDTLPRPVEGYSSSDIDFSDDEFQYTRKGEDTWAARCITEYTGIVTGQVKLSVNYEGAGAVLFVKGVQKAKGGPSSGGAPATISATVTIEAGSTPIQVLYYRDGPGGSLQLLADGKVASTKVLAFEASTIIPTVSSVSPSEVNKDGNGQLQIMGTGFFNEPKVTIGTATPEFTVISAQEIVIGKLPSQAQAGANPALVKVTNKAGESNTVELTYTESQKKGVAWKQTFFKFDNGGKYNIQQVTSIAIGPDAHYYMGALTGVVFKVKAGKDLVVKTKCTSQSISTGGKNRAILGIAFNYKSKVLRLYATSNTLYWGGANAGPTTWANGNIESFTSGCGCMCFEKTVITGLPVSNHDHGVNSVLFLNNGDLLISVGGATNAGHNTPNNKLGGFPETPLSAAILVAKLSKGAAFDGAIKYDQYTNPAAAKQISGDVETYATGLRNCFDMTLMTNGDVWATDNGGNFGYGDVSKSCTEHVFFSVKQFDEVNLIKKGSYYGHANRNRNECVHSQFGAGVAPKVTVISSTPGIVEYTSNVFGGNLKGEIILSKYAASGNGVVSRYTGGSSNPVPMAQYSGLSITNGLHGELIMPRVQQGFVAVLEPDYAPESVPMMIAVSPRRGITGSRVHIGGEKFKQGMTVNFGAAKATDVVVESAVSAFCTVPAGSGNVKVTVSVDGVSSAPKQGFDFIYL